MGLQLTGLLAVLALAACAGEDYSDCGGALPLDTKPFTYQATLDEWAGPVREDGSRVDCSIVVAGSCADGRRFLVQQGLATFVRYFDARGELVASAGQVDVSFDHCNGASFSPSLAAVQCDSPGWDRLCGDGQSSLGLPFSDGTPNGMGWERSVQP